MTHDFGIVHESERVVMAVFRRRLEAAPDGSMTVPEALDTLRDIRSRFTYNGSQEDWGDVDRNRYPTSG